MLFINLIVSYKVQIWRRQVFYCTIACYKVKIVECKCAIVRKSKYCNSNFSELHVNIWILIFKLITVREKSEKHIFEIKSQFPLNCFILWQKQASICICSRCHCCANNSHFHHTEAYPPLSLLLQICVVCFVSLKGKKSLRGARQSFCSSQWPVNKAHWCIPQHTFCDVYLRATQTSVSYQSLSVYSVDRLSLASALVI